MMGTGLSAALPPRGRRLTPPGGRPQSRADRLGPIATWLAQVYVVGALIYSFGVIYEQLPPAFSLVLLGPGLGCLVLAPRRLVRHLRISVPLAMLLGWTVLSWSWSYNPDQTLLRLGTQVPTVLVLVAVTGLLQPRDLVTALKWSIRLTLLLVVARLVTDPGSRTTGDSELVVEGWKGSFSDKNSLGLYLVFALTVTLVLDRGWSRVLTTCGVGVLLAGSQSATSLSAAIVVVLVWMWLALWRSQQGRQSALFVLASIGLVVVAIGAALSSYTAILEVYGKDADLTGRTAIWAAVAHAVTDRPLTGYGLGALFNLGDPSSQSLLLWHEIGFKAAHAHNGVLDLVGQLGVVGLLLFLATLWTTLRTAVRSLRVEVGVASTAVLMISALLVMSVSEPVFLGPWLLVIALLQAPFLRTGDHERRVEDLRSPRAAGRRPRTPTG